MEFKSQIGQDEWVCKMLNNKRDGYFLDIGANDGVWMSNTYYLEKKLGWIGICVEPALKPFSRLVNTRNCICVNKAVYNRTGIVSFHDYPEEQWRGHIDSNGRKVECITLQDLIKEYDCPKLIDYISIDVEGLEYEILTAFPFDEYTARLWTIEHNDDERGLKRDKIRDLMYQNGYSFVTNRTSGLFEDWFYL
jgi:FkbM family methyltransferase